jgi:hypothetical protein
MLRTLAAGSLCCLLPLLTVPAAAGPPWPLEQKIRGSDRALQDRFGSSMSVDGDLALIGARFHSGGGAAYVFRYDGAFWREETKLTAFDRTSGDSFGSSVSISGNVALVGAPNDEDGGTRNGSAYVYRFDGSQWVYEAKFTVPDVEENHRFGHSVSVDGDVAVVGTFPLLGSGVPGAAYVFRDTGSGWVQEEELAASDAGADHQFGSSVSASGDAILVGAGNRRAAYVYRYDGTGWPEEDRLTPFDGLPASGFGWSVSLSDDVALIGAFRDSDLDNNAGSAYVYRYDGASWLGEEKLLASDSSHSTEFGRSVSVSGDVALVGRWGDSHAGVFSGSAYVFAFDGNDWLEEAKLTAFDAAMDDEFGNFLALGGDVALVGVERKEDTGVVYAFRFTPNHPPVAEPGGPYVLECVDAVESTTTRLDGRASMDPDFDPLTYLWSVAGPASLDDPTSRTPLLDATGVTLGFGFGVDLKVDDGFGESATASTSATVLDTRPPIITVRPPAALDVECNVDAYVDPGAHALDLCEGRGPVAVGGDTVDPGAPGTYVVTYDAEDTTGNAVQATRPVSVVDTTAPEVTLQGDAAVTLECAVDAYAELGASAADVCDPSVGVAIGGEAPDPSTPDTYVVTYDALDASGNSGQATRTVLVQDTIAPQVQLSVSPQILWPANHQMSDVTVTAAATDACDGSPAITLVSVVSNEPDNGTRDGNTGADIQGAALGTADFELALRAERSASGSGRVYTITYRATDASGNSTDEAVTVFVPNASPARPPGS